jgi:hypothetical protein
MVEYAFGGNLESGALFCVGAFGGILAALAVKAAPLFIDLKMRGNYMYHLLYHSVALYFVFEVFV